MAFFDNIPDQIMNEIDDENIDPKKNTLDKNGNIRFDYQFSYWILLWAILYYLIKIKYIYFSSKFSFINKTIYEYGNPLYALYFALIENIINLFILMVYNASLYTIFKFTFMILIIKAIPTYLLHDSPIHPKENIIVCIAIFMIYIFYLYLCGTNIVDVYTKTIYFIYTEENKTPLFSLLHSFGIR